MTGGHNKGVGKNLNNVFAVISNKRRYDDLLVKYMEREAYIAKLEASLKENNMELPLPEPPKEKLPSEPPADRNVLKDASEEQLGLLLAQQKKLVRDFDITIEFENLSFKVEVPLKQSFPSVSTVLRSIICFWTNCAPKEEIRILSNLTGQISPRKMTLLIGPPGSGKSGKFKY